MGGSFRDRDAVIGVDFDNTLVGYDELMTTIATQRGLIPLAPVEGKKGLRDKIRQLPDGETEWQKLQAIAYGVKMGEARLISAVQPFFQLCKLHKVSVYITSHKTQYANLDETGTDLRAAAIEWMSRNRFFEPDGMGLSQDQVYFESTQREKIERIRRLRCTHFIDDLEETFLEDSFPLDVEKILFSQDGSHSSLPGVRAFIKWEEITDYFFHATD